MWMDSKSFSIFCPEHNEYVEYVCLMNSCYQKLLCSQCMKKHKNIHKNEQVQLCELINELRGFQCGRLLEGEDLAGYHDQVRSGHRILRDNEGKPSDWVTVSVMRSVNGKDQEIKRRLFEEKAIQKKNSLINNQVETLSNTIRTFVSSMERKILVLQRRLSEGVDRQLTKATSRSVLEVKFIKDACIQQILEALKNNTDRYNQLSRSLQQFHKGYLELTISKNIFKDITKDIAQRMKQFNHNLAVFFDGEVERLFSFILDDSDLSEISSNNEANIINNHGNNTSSSSGYKNKSIQEMMRQRPEDEKQMQKMIDQLKEISRETQEKTDRIEDGGVYTNSHADEDLSNSNNVLDAIEFQNYQNSSADMSNQLPLQQQKQHQQGYSQMQLLQYSNPLLYQHIQPMSQPYYLGTSSAGLKTNHNNNSTFLNTPTKNFIISPAPSSSQSLTLPNNTNNNDSLLAANEIIPSTKPSVLYQPLSKSRRAEIARSLDYQKKEIKIDLKGIEKEKYSAAQKQLNTMLGSIDKGRANKDNGIDMNGNSVIITGTPKAGSNLPTASPNSLVSPDQNEQLRHSASLPFQQKPVSNFRISHKNTMSTTSTSMFNPNTVNNASNKNQNNNNFSDLTESSNYAAQVTSSGAQLSKDQVNSVGALSLASNPSRQMSRTSLLASLTNPNLRTYSSLSSLQTPNSNLLRNQTPLPEQAKALNRSTSDAVLADSFQLLKPQSVIATHSEHSCLFDYQGSAQEKSVVIGMLSVMMNRYILFHESGVAQVWECQKNEVYVENNNNNAGKNTLAGGAGTLEKKNNTTIKTTPTTTTTSSGLAGTSAATENQPNLNTSSSQSLIGQLKKWKELNFNRRITCITEMNDTDGQVDPLMFSVACQNYDQSEFAVFIMKYECRKNRFFQIDCMKFSTAISTISCTFDKQFKRKNLPSSLQLVTDVYYFFTLHPFDDAVPSNESANSTPMSKTTMNPNNNKPMNSPNSNSTPILRMLRVQLHRDKHGSVESEILSTIKIDQGIMISRIIYDPMNECLWGHSDYYLFKWTINYLTGVIEKANCLQLCKTPRDIITSMLLNTKMLIVSSLSGNLWGIDVMMNKVFEKDCQRFKYSQINSYNAKIQGKDQIQILSGSLLQIQRHSRYMNPDSSSSNNNKSSGIERYFLYSTLSAAGPKLFCFKPEFREVAGIIPGQNTHVQLAVATELDEENDLIVAIEDFRFIRVYERGIPKMEMQ